MSRWYWHVKLGKDFGVVRYSLPGGGLVQRTFTACWALLRWKGAAPWIEVARKLGAYHVTVEYKRAGVRHSMLWAHRADGWAPRGELARG